MRSLCVDFGGSTIKVGVLDGDLIVAKSEFAASGTVEDLAAVRRVVAGYGNDALGFHGVGIALPGVIDRVRGCLVAAHGKYDYALGLDVRSWAEEAFRAPAVVENDARAALLGETTYGCAAGEKNAVIVLLGTGIGTAAMLDGQLLRGVHDSAGILGGHVTVQLEGEVCNCGNVGCAEAIASTWALAGLVRSHPEFGQSAWWQERIANGRIGFKELLERPTESISRDLGQRVISAWGAATVSLCHSFDPEVVVVAGGVMRASDTILPVLDAYVHAHLWSFSPRPRLVSPNAPEVSVLRGLSVLAAQASEERPKSVVQ